MKVRLKELGLQRVRVNLAGCLDRCELGPSLVIYPEGIWYRIESTADVDRILERHLLEGERVPELMMPSA
jgi:(2Fe-2S) ferredoxin